MSESIGIIDQQSLPSHVSDDNNPKAAMSGVRASAKSHHSHPTISGREFVALLLIIALCDLTFYRSYGYAGPSMLFLIAPLLICLGTETFKWDHSIWFIIPMLLLASLRLVWCGSELAVVCGFVLLSMFAMSLVGVRPYIAQLSLYIWHLLATGHRGIERYVRFLIRTNPAFVRNHWFSLILPLTALLGFSSIFIVANPDLVKYTWKGLNSFFELLENVIRNFRFSEILFCIGTGWIAVNVSRPVISTFSPLESPIFFPDKSKPSPLYDAYRNTLMVVIGLFAVYLPFEFSTLWFKTFPKGFYYSGYAHEGAAWLTVALGLTTLMLSVFFRGTIIADQRLSNLKTLAWIWSVENLILAIAVFNRLFIYIGFNGMTRMRVVGMLGVASVIAGFILVLRKIARNYDFTWLIRRQMWTVCFAMYLYAVLPVDGFVNLYNVNRILNGNLAPIVQISVHPTSDEGILCLAPLTHCSDDLIRNGVRMLLARELRQKKSEATEHEQYGWTTTQIANRLLIRQLESAVPDMHRPGTIADEDVALKRFHDYAYQWY